MTVKNYLSLKEVLRMQKYTKEENISEYKVFLVKNHIYKDDYFDGKVIIKYDNNVHCIIDSKMFFNSFLNSLTLKNHDRYYFYHTSGNLKVHVIIKDNIVEESKHYADNENHTLLLHELYEDDIQVVKYVIDEQFNISLWKEQLINEDIIL